MGEKDTSLMRIADLACKNDLAISIDSLDEVTELYTDEYNPYVRHNPYIRVGIAADVKPDNTLDFFERVKKFMMDCSADSLIAYEEKADENTSDGYHTFKELYHHRALLFSVIVHKYKNRAWKSMKHDDGSMYDGMFIVGIETPWGQATYHYDMDPYWDIFDCKVLEYAPRWDGHTPTDAIDRIAKLVELD